MKTLKVLSFLFFLIQTNIFPQGSKWSWVAPYPTGAYLNSVYFLNSSTGFLLGRGGVLMKTIDTAKTWTQLNVPSTVDFNEMVFADSLKGWVYGSVDYSQPVIYKTFDGGEKWFKQTLPVQQNLLKDIFFLDSLYGWTAGDNGLILKTTNGGKSWQNKSITSGIVPSVVYIKFDNMQNGTILGSHYFNSSGLVLGRTSNGGDTWEFAESGIQNNLIDAVTFDSTIITVGYRLILRSQDSGTNWSFKMKTPLEEYQCIDFADSKHGIIGSLSGDILRTSNAGITWESLQDKNNTSWVSVQYIKENNIWACGSGIFGKTNAIVQSTDNGDSWKNRSRSLEDIFQISGMHFSSSKTGWLTGGNFIYKSIDSGKTWSRNYSSNSTYLGDIVFIDSLNGFACGTSNGQKAVILTTTNGGSSWETGYYNSFTSFYKFSAPNADTMYALDGFGVAKSTDRGKTWNGIYSSIAGYISDFYFITGSDGYLVNQNGSLFKTTDGGISWTFSQLSPYETFYRVSFPTNETGYVLGSSSIYKTSDGGKTWTNMSLPEYAYDIIFTNAVKGWLITSSGIYSTTDGGIKWNMEFPSLSQMYSFFYNQNGLWLTGEFSRILKYTADPLVNVQENNTATLPGSFSLGQNYPNPFNPSTTIKYSLPLKSSVLLRVYNILGEEVVTLINEEKPAGMHTFRWDAGAIASGIYVYRLEAVPLDNSRGKYTESKKLILLK